MDTHVCACRKTSFFWGFTCSSHQHVLFMLLTCSFLRKLLSSWEIGGGHEDGWGRGSRTGPRVAIIKLPLILSSSKNISSVFWVPCCPRIFLFGVGSQREMSVALFFFSITQLCSGQSHSCNSWSEKRLIMPWPPLAIICNIFSIQSRKLRPNIWFERKQRPEFGTPCRVGT